MRISTTNPGGRTILRAAREDINPRNFGYRALGGSVGFEPHLSVTLEGFDGKRYNVVLSAADIEAIAIARQTYAEHFQPKGA